VVFSLHVCLPFLLTVLVVTILLYADDIALLAPSLQLLLHTCEDEVSCLDMRLNNKKSVCIRIGPRYKADCCNLVTRDNCKLLWCNSIRYLDVYMTSSAVFTCSFSNYKTNLFDKKLFGLLMHFLAVLAVPLHPASLYSCLKRNVCRCYTMALKLVLLTKP